MSVPFSMKKMLFVALAAFVLTGCTSKDFDDIKKHSAEYKSHDPELGYTADDFRNAMAPRPIPQSAETGQAPDLAPVIAEDKKNILPQPLVSITVNQDVPLRDIFFELAKQAEVDLELDPTITGSIIFTAYNRPFDQVVERISDMAGLRYTFKNNVLRVERDTPYLKTYHVDYLGVQRTYDSSINSNTSAATTAAGSIGGGGGSSGGGNNGSTSSINSKNSTDFWDELQKNISQIINSTNKQVALTDQSTPITTPSAIPAVPADQLAAVNANGQAQNAAGQPQTTPPNLNQNANSPAASIGMVLPTPAPTPGLMNPSGIQSAAVIGGNGNMNGMGAAGGMSGAGAGGTGTGSGGAQQNPYFSVNKQAGLVNVFATEKQHQKIGAYITEMMRGVNTQVLIEAKVFEVELTDENSLGIDWNYISTGGSTTGQVGATFDRPGLLTPIPTGNGATVAISRGDFSLLIQAISRFGTVHALSSPRLTVMNNQTAVLNVSESRVFFDFDIQRTEGTANSAPRIDITSEVKNVPEGIVITVNPSVNPDTQEITMNLRPSITRVVRTVSDPAVAYLVQQAGGNLDIENLVPELSVREIDSIVKMHSGTTLVMGGLMQDRNANERSSVPVLGEVPVLGNLFRSRSNTNHKSEMVIMLRATVLDNPKPDATDADLYKRMGQDRHPFPM